MANADYSQSQQLGINAYVPRGAFVDFHNRPQRWAVMVCHRRAGKTVACVADLVLSALVTNKQDARYAYIAPQLNQAKDIAWGYLKNLTADIPLVHYNESELRADLPNGARIRLYGADNPDRLRGLYLDGVILDEYADMKPSVWGEIVRPLLSDRLGWAVFIGTPKGHNEFWRIWNERKDLIDWFSLMLRASESGLIPQTELESAKREISEDQYEQEYECSFSAAVKGAYYAKDIELAEREGRICEVPYDDELPVYTAWDIGYSDDTAVWFWQMVRGEVHIIDYYAANGHGVDHYTEMLNAKGYNYAKLSKKPFLWLPHDARAKTFASGGKSTQQQFRENGYESLIAPELGLQDGIQAARATLPACWFDAEKCYEGIEALKLYRREWDEDKKVFRDKPLHDWTSHPADGFRYLSCVWREQVFPKPEEPPKWKEQQTFNELRDSISRRRKRED